ncbi:MAG: phosphoglycolate phosphatase [Pseudonocardiales bacterium]|jgi:phosphoglycolate phosphatase|nr:phosphoglycolate phosphatase [Pseudonocardiales bacterium]
MSDAGPFDIVLFDLDGTLTDSAPGILDSLRKAFADLGLPWIDETTARSLLGPPFYHTLPPLVGADRVAETIAAYRSHYVDDGGMYLTSAYQGIPELLDALSARGVPMAVATSKPEIHARQILAHLGLVDHFATIGGDTLDGDRDSKALVVGEVLRRLGDPDPDCVLMVGDRSHDVLGSAAHRVSCAGVLWGYGTTQELTAAGALRLVSRPADLLALTG